MPLEIQAHWTCTACGHKKSGVVVAGDDYDERPDGWTKNIADDVFCSRECRDGYDEVVKKATDESTKAYKQTLKWGLEELRYKRADERLGVKAEAG